MKTHVEMRDGQPVLVLGNPLDDYRAAHPRNRVFSGRLAGDLLTVGNAQTMAKTYTLTQGDVSLRQ